MKAEVGAAEARGKAEAEKAGLQTALDAALSRSEAEQSSLQSSIHRLETETKDYKVSCVMHAAQLRMLLSSSSCCHQDLACWTASPCIWWHSPCTANQMAQIWMALFAMHCKPNGPSLDGTLQHWQPCGMAFAGTCPYLVAAERDGTEQSQGISC